MTPDCLFQGANRNGGAVDACRNPDADRSFQAKSSAVGPHLWRAWLAAPSEEPIAGKEYLLYTDATMTCSSSVLKIGPVELSAVSGGTGNESMLRPSLVARMWEFPGSEQPLRPGFAPPTRADHFWLGLTLDEELAALLSLVLGIRLRSGGPTRRFTPDDPHGHDVREFEHRSPGGLPQPGFHRPMVDDLTRTVALDDVRDYLPHLPCLKAKPAVALMRAARSYADGLWVADHEPEIAWLHLITALEVAAEQYNDDVDDPVELLREWNPDLANLLREQGSDDLLAQASALLRKQTGVRRKFDGFVAAFPPQEPEARSEHRWARIPELVGSQRPAGAHENHLRPSEPALARRCVVSQSVAKSVHRPAGRAPRSR